MSAKFAEYFGNDVDDGSYKAWRTCQQGSAMTFKLVPAEATGEPTWYIPYLQTITIKLHPQSSQLTLLCHGTDMTIFIEGSDLDELAEAISEKRVKSIHQFDQRQYGTVPNSQAMVMGIKIEE